MTLSAEQSPLFQPLQVGSIIINHRLAMAPLTRFRADNTHVPLPFVSEYYSQRASVPGTLLISEGTFIDARAGGLANVPGIYNADQIAAWKKITTVVHEKGSFIYCQLWALGRGANPRVASAEGIQVVSSSATPITPKSVTPKELSKGEIREFIEMYAQAAKNAIEAGFDGVELHGANGYLIDQFTQDTCNRRTDEYGGSVENRSRFCLEAIKAVVGAIGAHRTGLRLSPWTNYQGMRMKDPVIQFSYLIGKLKDLDLAYLHLIESRVDGNTDVQTDDTLDFAIDIWGPDRVLLVAGGYKPKSARELVENERRGHKIVVALGRYFISTPDLPFRVQHDLGLARYDRSKFYKPKAPDGYIDYPFSAEFLHSMKGGREANL